MSVHVLVHVHTYVCMGVCSQDIYFQIYTEDMKSNWILFSGAGNVFSPLVGVWPHRHLKLFTLKLLKHRIWWMKGKGVPVLKGKVSPLRTIKLLDYSWHLCVNIILAGIPLLSFPACYKQQFDDALLCVSCFFVSATNTHSKPKVR